MPGGDVETAYENGMWSTRLVGQGRSARFFQTRDRAVEAGRDLARARRVAHIIKNQDGTVAEHNNDRRDLPGASG